MTGHVVSFEPSVRGALRQLSHMYRGSPFSIERMEIRGAAEPWKRLLIIIGKAGLGDQEISFRVPFTLLTSIPPRTDEWSESERAAFLSLSDYFASQRMPFTVHAMVAELPRISGFERVGGTTLVVRTASRVVRFQGDCGYRPGRGFTASVFVWETQEKGADGTIVSWGWERWWPQISME